MKETLLFAAMGTGFTFLMTTLGASIVFFIKREIEQKLQRAFLGFAAGVMLAASLWSLLIPAIEGAQEAGKIGWLPAAGGFLLGGLFLFGLDILVRRLRSKKIEKNEKQELLQEGEGHFFTEVSPALWSLFLALASHCLQPEAAFTCPGYWPLLRGQ